MKKLILPLILTSVCLMNVNVFASNNENANYRFKNIEQLKSYYNLPRIDYKLKDINIATESPTNRINDNSEELTMIYASEIKKIYSNKEYVIRASTHARYKDELRTVDELSVISSYYERNKKSYNWDYKFNLDSTREKATDVQVEKTVVFPEKYMRLFSLHTINTKNYREIRRERDIEVERSIF